jgi:oligoribonuclease
VDVQKDSIIEIAAVLTDANLNIVAEGPDIVIHADREVFEHIPQNVREIHEKSGIIEESVASTVSEKDAEEKVLGFLAEHVVKESSPLCGNSIHMDRMFLYTRMPNINRYLHYRNIDVSTLKELGRRWAPEAFSKYKKEGTHRAKDDILQSIDEMRFWRKEVLKM